MGSENYIRFDWAMKRLLRNKVNFGILEGFLTTLLNETITIKSILESESNQESASDKQNRVDILAENSKNELILIEVQNTNEYAYFQRMLFGTSKLITNFIERGQGYEEVRKVYCINIVYFPLGKGSDYVYYGKTEFRGINNNELLELSMFQMEKFDATKVSDIFPEYYILRINEFNKVAASPLEEWIYYLNTGKLPDNAEAPGLDKVRERLSLDKMKALELESYYRHLENRYLLQDNIDTSREEGRLEGLAEGKIEGKLEGKLEGIIAVAKNLKINGIPTEIIAQNTGLSIEEIDKL